MDFTAAFRHASAACIAYSPGSTFLASVSGELPRTLLVRASSTLQVIRSWDFDTDIDTIEWSSDGSFILATTTDKQEEGVVYVVSLDPGKEANDGSDGNQGWVARIASGSEGLVGATWTPLVGPRSVVLFSQHQLRASIYSLPDQTISAIEGPKRSKLIRTSRRPDRFAMIMKGADRDLIHVFKCAPLPSKVLRETVHILKSEEQWQLDESFSLATNDCADAAWSPDSLHIAVWEGQLEYKVLIYTALGRLRSMFVIDPQSGDEPMTRAPHLDASSPAPAPRPSASLSQSVLRSSAVGSGSSKLRSSTLASSTSASARSRKDEDAPLSVAGGGLGIREVQWHPSGRYLALGGYDEQVRILENEEWSEDCTFDLSKRMISGPNGDEALVPYGRLRGWREPQNWFEDTHARGIVSFETASLPVAPAALRVVTDKANPKLGVSWMEWSPDGHLIASFNERFPFTLFIHAFSSDDPGEQIRPYLLSVLQLNLPVKRATWRPAHCGKLAVVCESQAIYTWELLDDPTSEVRYTQRVEAIPIPIDDFRATEVRWSPDGQKILIVSNHTFCCAFETLEDAGGYDDPPDEAAMLDYSQ
ncbi:hypothetical protein ACQY0O_000508 [Thecaphora frezii]